MSRLQSRTIYRALGVLSILVFFFLALDTVVAKAPTVDETLHVARGGALWQGQDFRIQTQPPLSHWINGVFLFTEPTFPQLSELDAWPGGRIKEISDELYGETGLNIDRVFFLARLPIAFTALIFGAFLGAWVMRWRRRLLASALVFLLFALSPNLLAFASLATTDLVTAASYTVAILCTWSYVQLHSRLRWLVASVALGLALTAKLTTFILLPLTLLLFLSEWKPGRPLKELLFRWVALLPVAALVVWAVYRFEVGSVRALSLPVPAATYVSNFLDAQSHIERGHSAFLLGELSRDGWWYYFPVTFLLKTPLPVLLLLPVMVVSLVRNASRWRNTLFIWLPAVSLFVVASASGLNIGYRHILPIVPFLWLGAACSFPDGLQAPRRATRVVIAALILWYAAGTFMQHPHYLAYFNRIVGSENGYRYLSDSNVDWGQDLKLLAEFVESHDGEPVHYSYLGPIDPAYYGLEKEPLFDDGQARADFSPANPAPGNYAISASHLQGAVLPEPDLFNWFWRRRPAGNLGYSILLYEVDEAAQGKWIAHCLDPEPILSEEAVERLVGARSVRHVYFDCSSSWVFPGGGEPGWYVLPQTLSPGPLAERFPDRLQQVYTRQGRGYEIAYWNGERELLEALSPSPGDVSTPEDGAVSLPVSAGGKARLISYWSRAQGSEGHEWATAWQAQEPDVGLSIAGHLHSGQGEPLVDDGLGFSSEQWQEGDVFVQYHRFPAVAEVGYMTTALYYYANGQRLPFAVEGGTASLLRLRAANER